MIRLFHQDALEFLQAKPKGYRTIWMGYRTIWMDVPDNIGVDYGEPDDQRSDYFDWLQSLITLGMRTGACSIWLSYNSKHDVELKYRIFKILRARSHWTARTIIWRYTFGCYRTKDHTYGYRPILRLNIKGYPWKFDRIRVESERMKLGDPRAAGFPVALVERIFKVSGGPVLELFTGSGSAIIAARAAQLDLESY
jgi:hypothetical protein